MQASGININRSTASNAMLVVVRVLHRQFSVMVFAGTIEEAETKICGVCGQVDFQIMNVVKIK